MVNKDMKKVGVLCRGKSLVFLNSLPDVDGYVIPNWESELNQQFVIDRFSDNKPIINILSLATINAPPAIGLDGLVKNYKNFNIQKIVIPYVKEILMSKAAAGERAYFDVKIGDRVISSEPLPDIVKPFMWKKGSPDCPDNIVVKYEYDIPTTGIAGVLYAAAVMDADEIHICGMDFYEEVYAFQTDREREWTDRIGIAVDETIPMKIFLTENIINRFPNKKFYINTYGNYNPSGDNVVVNNLNKKV